MHKNWQSNTRVSLLFVVMILQNDQSVQLCFPIAIFRSTGAGVERGEGEREGGRTRRRVSVCVRVRLGQGVSQAVMTKRDEKGIAGACDGVLIIQTMTFELSVKRSEGEQGK